MKNQALFSSKDKSKKLKCRLLQFLFGALRFKGLSFCHFFFQNMLQSIAPPKFAVLKTREVVCVDAR